MSVRAKVRVDSVEDGRVRMSPVVGGSPENDRFFDATPWGSIELGVVNQDALGQFEAGREYYVDFSPAD